METTLIFVEKPTRNAIEHLKSIYPMQRDRVKKKNDKEKNKNCKERKKSEF